MVLSVLPVYTMNPYQPDLTLCPVPSAVTGLQVENLNTTCSLQVSWQEALGVADGYILQVLDDRDSLVTNSSQPSGHTSYRFDGLIPGKKYRVLVQTTSGGIHSLGVSAEARTRKTSCFQLVQARVVLYD